MLFQFQSNTVCPRSLGPIYILGYFENKSEIAIKNVEEGLQIWVELILIQHYIQKPDLGPDHNLTVKKNRIQSLKHDRICPLKKTPV